MNKLLTHSNYKRLKIVMKKRGLLFKWYCNGENINGLGCSRKLPDDIYWFYCKQHCPSQYKDKNGRYPKKIDLSVGVKY